MNAFGCPYPAVGTNCQVNIVAQAPAVPLLSTEFVADEYATLKADTQASYKCDQGYELLGQETLTCLASGRWSAPTPSCVTNIAIGKPTNQSSTVKGGESRNANDGKLITQHDSKYCTETRVDQSPWWQIDLLQLYEIKSVRILGRACCNPQLSLHDIEIRIGNSSTLQGNRLCAWYPNNLDEGVARDFQCAHPIIGRFVSIQMVGIESALSLCEVMVFSTKEFPTERCSVQATLAPSNKPQTSASTTTTSATTTMQTSGLSASSGAADNQLVVFNRTCYEMQATNGGSFLVADTYCKARGGALLHSVNNLTQAFISHELERMKTKLKSKLIWLGAKREISSSNSLGSVTSGSSSAAFAASDQSLLAPSGGRISMLADEFASDSLFSSEQGLASAGESSPIFSPLVMARTSLYQSSSGAGGSTSRGSQTFGLPTTGVQQQQQHAANRSLEHSQRSLIISQPNQVASFFTPPVPLQVSNQASAIISPAPSASPSNPVSFSTPHAAHRSLRPPSLVLVSASSPTTAPSSVQPSWLQSGAPLAASSLSQLSSGSSWRWVGDAPSETISSPVTSFMWAEDQPNNYNNQQDCMVLDGAKKWLWNDVTCELDYLPWVCQYRPSTCGSPDRHENSTILELASPTQDSAGVAVSEPAFQFGKTITYACPVGHKMADGSRQRRCQYDGTWSGKAPKCHYVNCGPLNAQSIENGRIVYLNQSQTTFGSQVKYVCYEDYVLVGSDLRQCQADARWDGKQPYCAYKWCPALQQIANGFLNVSSYSENSIASYQCNSGYKLIGNDTRQCLLGGKWTNQEPFCQYVDCGQPKQIPNGSFQLLNSTTNYLSVALYTCHDNYTLVGTNNKMICSHNNRWTGKEPQCSLIDCGQPQANPGSSFTGSSFTVHSSVEYKCDAGFKEIGGNSKRTCGADAQWTGQPVSCKYVDCGRVPAILKGEVSYVNGTTYLASQVAYECTPGNRLSGHRVRFCAPDGRWTGSSPKCEEVRCDAPSLPANGSAIYIGNDRSFKEQSFSVGVTVQYECDYGHVVRGSWSSRLCQANGEWSGEPPVCKFVDCGPAPSIENGLLSLKHPPAGSVGSATPLESQRRSDGPSGGVNAASGGSAQAAGTFTYYGTIAHYSCEPNYKLQGPAQRECLESGEWRKPLPSCEQIQCPKPDYFDEFTQVALVARANSNTEAQSEAAAAPSSSTTTTTSSRTTISTRLIANNQWLQPDAVAFGVGDKLHYSCVAGYELYGGPEVRTCTQYGQWSGSSTPRCRLIDCGRPQPIGQEGRFYLLNESTSFNSLVEYSCVRPFKLVEVKIRQAGNLIETLTAAQAGVTPILTSLPVGVKVCANNGQWMPNDQQPKCVSAASPALETGFPSAPHFDGSDNTLEGSQRVSTLANGAGTSFVGPSGQLDASQAGDSARQLQSAGSLWAKLLAGGGLLAMFTLILLALICVRSGKRPKQATNVAHQHQQQQRGSLLAAGLNQASAAQAAAMQLQLASGAALGAKQQQQQQQQQQHQHQQQIQQHQPALMQAGVFAGGAHKLLPAAVSQAQLASLQQAASLHQQLGQPLAYGDASASSLMLAAKANQQRAMLESGELLQAQQSAHQLVLGRKQQDSLGNEHNMCNAMEAYALEAAQLRANQSNNQSNNQQQTSKTIRHNPNGLVTFVSPAQQLQQQQQQQQQLQHQQQASSQHQASPQSISSALSLSAASSPSSSSSAHHTTATRLSTTDSASSSSSSANSASQFQANQLNQPQLYAGQALAQPQAQGGPPSLPAQPPPSHRLQQHHKQLMKQQQQQQQQQLQRLQPARPLQQQQQQPSSQAASHHYMEPTM